MNITHDGVSAWLTVELLDDDGNRRELCAAIRWTRTDAYSVHVVFDENHGNPVRWAWSRDLLIEGLTRVCGGWDIRVGPLGDKVTVTLSTHDGKAYVLVDHRVMSRFLTATTDIVPLGGESYDLDVELAFLLADGEAV